MPRPTDRAATNPVAAVPSSSALAIFAAHPHIGGMTDLFGNQVVAGLSLRHDLITHAEETALIAAIDQSDLSPFRFQNWTGKRLTRSFGWRYDFDTAQFARTDPMPEWLLPVRASAAEFAGIPPEDLVQALVIRYDPGAGIGWHRDRPVFEHVVGLSLGNPATLRLRRLVQGGFERAQVPLAPRSVYHLSGPVRHEWEHSIAAMTVPRWSVTFRSLSAKGRRFDQR